MKINVISSQGLPQNPRTWSGTTNNIYQVLKKNDDLEGAYEAATNNIFFKISKLILRVYYKLILKNTSINPLMQNLIRRLNAYSAMLFTRESKSNHTLHFGTLNLPFYKKPNDQYHYIYTDGTWHMWSKYATDIDKLTDSQIKAIGDMEKKSYEQSVHIFSISEYVKDDLINFYNIMPSKVTVVGTGTGIIKPYFGAKNYKNGKILFVAKGRFDDKGGNLVLQAFFLALGKNPKLHLSIVGQSQYAHIPVHPNITTYGFVSIEELQNLFNESSLFLMPALNEPWGLVYIEAMLCKMPIIGISRNSFPELSGHGQFGVAIDDPNFDSIAQSIISLFELPERMEKMGLAGQKNSLNKYNWDNTATLIMGKITEIAQENRN